MPGTYLQMCELGRNTSMLWSSLEKTGFEAGQDGLSDDIENSQMVWIKVS